MEWCTHRSTLLALCTIGIIGMMIAANFSTASLLIVSLLLCLTVRILARFGDRARAALAGRQIGDQSPLSPCRSLRLLWRRQRILRRRSRIPHLQGVRRQRTIPEILINPILSKGTLVHLARHPILGVRARGAQAQLSDWSKNGQSNWSRWSIRTRTVADRSSNP